MLGDRGYIRECVPLCNCVGTWAAFIRSWRALHRGSTLQFSLAACLAWCLSVGQASSSGFHTPQLHSVGSIVSWLRSYHIAILPAFTPRARLHMSLALVQCATILLVDRLYTKKGGALAHNVAFGGVQVTFTVSTTICCACSSTEDTRRRPTTCSLATTSTVASRASRPSACCLPSRSSTPRTSSCCVVTTSVPRSTASTVSTMSVCGARPYSCSCLVSSITHCNACLRSCSSCSSCCRQAPIQHQVVEDLHGLLQLPPDRRHH